MATYQVDIVDLKSGEERRVPMPCQWSEDGSPHMWSNYMCDCNIAGYFNMGQTIQGKWVAQPGQDHGHFAHSWRKEHTCKHSVPPTRFRPVQAILSDGRVINGECFAAASSEQSG